jgi:hypothetical protein
MTDWPRPRGTSEAISAAGTVASPPIGNQIVKVVPQPNGGANIDGTAQILNDTVHE